MARVRRILFAIVWVLLALAPVDGSASGGEVLPPTRIASLPWGMAIDGAGVLRFDVQRGQRTQLSLYLDDASLAETVCAAASSFVGVEQALVSPAAI